MPEEKIICPIRFIRKPEESECVKELCAFWVDGELYDSESKGPVRFSAVMNISKGQEEAESVRRRLGKCAVLAIAEEMVKSRQH